MPYFTPGSKLLRQLKTQSGGDYTPVPSGKPGEAETTPVEPSAQHVQDLETLLTDQPHRRPE